jgi:hypothetical protein
MFIINGKQRREACNRFSRQAFDKILVGALAGQSARRQGDSLQGHGGGQQNAPRAQMFNHGGNDHVATI